MATSSITANFCISDAQEARLFVDRFVAAAKRRARRSPRTASAKVEVMNDPAEIRRFFGPRKVHGVR